MKVSIIVPFFNAESTIIKCINNILNQTYKEFEIILVNDGSTDNSDKIIKQYLSKQYLKKEQPRNLKKGSMKNSAKDFNKNSIKYYLGKKQTIGVGYARNYGIEKATGEYIMFVDADDYIECDLLEKLNNYIQQDIEVIKFNLKIETAKTEPVPNYPGQKQNRYQITRAKTEPVPNYPGKNGTGTKLSRAKTESAPNYPGKNRTGTKLLRKKQNRYQITRAKTEPVPNYLRNCLVGKIYSMRYVSKINI